MDTHYTLHTSEANLPITLEIKVRLIWAKSYILHIYLTQWKKFSSLQLLRQDKFTSSQFKAQLNKTTGNLKYWEKKTKNPKEIHSLPHLPDIDPREEFYGQKVYLCVCLSPMYHWDRQSHFSTGHADAMHCGTNWHLHFSLPLLVSLCSLTPS